MIHILTWPRVPCSTNIWKKASKFSDFDEPAYPWRAMQRAYPVTKDGVTVAIASEMAMKCVTATIVPNEGMEGVSWIEMAWFC